MSLKKYMDKGWGIEQLSRETVREHIDNIGDIKEIVCYYDTIENQYLTNIHGNKGIIVLTGFKWGDKSIGAMGLVWLLEETGWAAIANAQHRELKELIASLVRESTITFSLTNKIMNVQ